MALRVGYLRFDWTGWTRYPFSRCVLMRFSGVLGGGFGTRPGCQRDGTSMLLVLLVCLRFVPLDGFPGFRMVSA